MNLFDRTLYYYSLVFTLILSLGAIFSGFVLSNVIATLLFLPISLYFAYHLVKNIYIGHLRRVYARTHPEPSARSSAKHLTYAPFNLHQFLGQKNPVFMATLGLYGLVFTVLLFRATLTYLPKPPLISPIPANQLSIVKP